MVSAETMTAVNPGRPDFDGASRVWRRDVQGLRALAVLLVVCYHAHLPFPGGFSGVDMFFTISGFVIARMLLRELNRRDAIDFLAFYTRRVRRLLPALAVMVVLVAAASTVLLGPFGPHGFTAKTGIAAALFSANLQLMASSGGGYFDLGSETNAFLHTWSLSAEEQVYLFFPAFFLLLWRAGLRAGSRRISVKVVTSLMAVACLLSFVLSWHTTNHPPKLLGLKFSFYFAGARAWEFGFGALIALNESACARLGQVAATVLGMVGLVLVAIGAFAITSITPYPGVAALLPVTGTVLMLIAGTGSARGVSALLATRPAVWLGDRSYGWYLWHWPLIVFAVSFSPQSKWVPSAAAVASIVLAILSYRLVENPIRFNNGIVKGRALSLFVVCNAAAIVACLALVLISKAERRAATVQAFARAVRTPASRPGCDSAQPIGGPPETACTWPVENARGSVVLIGDSNAGQFSDPLSLAANQLGYSLTVATIGGCPFADVVRASAPGVFDGDECYAFVRESLRGMKRIRPSLVVIAMSSSQIVNAHGESWLRDPGSSVRESTPEAKATVWENGIHSVLKQLEDSGIPTLLIHSIPHLGDLAQEWQAATCPIVKLYAGTCSISISRENVERQQVLARTAEQRALERVPGAASADFTNDICLPGACSAQRNGIWMYRDATHLSVDGSLTLTDRFRKLLEEHAKSIRQHPVGLSSVP